MLLKTERLIIRPFCEEDAGAMAKLLQNREIAKTYMLPDLDEEKALKLSERFRTLSEDVERAVVGLFDGDGLVGFMNDVERDGTMIEMGYVIDPACWNRGYATEALTAMIAALFGRGYETVICGAFEENPASLRVMEKAGMTLLDRVDMIEYRGQRHRCLYRAARKNG